MNWRIYVLEKTQRVERGESDELQSRFEREVLKCRGSKEMLDFIAVSEEKADSIPERGSLRIGLVGEIYTLIEPYVNLNIENKLGSLGVGGAPRDNCS